MSTKKKLILHKKSISCRQKQHDAAPKKYFVLKKVTNFFRNGAPYLSILPIISKIFEKLPKQTTAFIN